MALTIRNCLTFKCSFCNAPDSKERPLKHCLNCQLVAYCSDDCKTDDWDLHKDCCTEFPIVNGNNALHTKRPWEKHVNSLYKRAKRLQYSVECAIPIFLYAKVCHYCRESRPELLTICKCYWACYCSEICAHSDTLHKKICKNNKKLAESFPLKYMRESYPDSFLYASSHVFEIGPDFTRAGCITTINIHVVTSTAYCDAKSWECILHQYSELEQINLAFIIQGKAYNPSLDCSGKLTDIEYEHHCEDCRNKNCVITYSVHQKPYHMFFSSPEYTEPDFVVAFGIPCTDGDIQSEISYRNMTYCEHTVLILMDSTRDRLTEGINAAMAARHIHVLEPPQRNMNRGFGANISELDFDAHAPNVKTYMACLERNTLMDD